jgi:hypothetical protein
MMAKIVAQAIINHMQSTPDSVEMALPGFQFLNGTTGAGLRFAVTKQGLVQMTGTFAITSTANQNIVALPRYLRSLRAMDIPVTAYGGTPAAPGPRLFMDPAGMIGQYDLPASTNQLFVQASWKGAF